MKSPRTARCHRSGHTLVEMMVVTTLLSLIMVFAAKAWKPLGSGTFRLRDRAVASTELRVALEFLRRDFGAAEEVQILDANSLRIIRENKRARLAGSAGRGRDSGIRYRLQGDVLLREEKNGLGEIAVARSISGFDLRRGEDSQVHLRIASGLGKDQRALRLVIHPASAIGGKR